MPHMQVCRLLRNPSLQVPQRSGQAQHCVFCCPVLQPLVAMLKVKLGAFGWAEALRRDASVSQWKGGAAAAAAELDTYLERMGVG